MCAFTGGAKLWARRYNRPKMQLLLLKSQEQKQGVRSKSRVLHRPPPHSTTKGVGKPPKPPLQLDPWTHLLPSSLYKDPAHPSLRERSFKGTYYISVLIPSCSQISPNKALLEFFVWPLIDFYRLKKANNTGQYQDLKLFQA